MKNLIINNLLIPVARHIDSNSDWKDSALTEELLEMIDLFRNPDNVFGCFKHKAMTPEKSYGRKSWNSSDLIWLELGASPWDIDRMIIEESKCLRRLDKKAQVQYKTNKTIDGFVKQLSPYVRNRLTHSLGVASDAVSLCQGLGLNDKLSLAAGMGHDVGHGPFSHTFEYYANARLKKVYNNDQIKFSHPVFSVDVLQKFERDEPEHANLTLETYLAIVKHSSIELTPRNIANYPWECFCNYWGDKFDYTFKDSNDSKRNYLPELQTLPFPKEYYQLGKNQRQRSMICKLAIIKECAKAGEPSEGDSKIIKTFYAFRKWMFDNVYYALNASPTRKETWKDLARARQWLEKEFPDYDSLLLLALCTDDEVLIMSQSIAQKRELPQEIKSVFGINELLHRLPKGLYVFGNIDLDPDHYTKR